jgi:hypothetical protein
LEEIPYRSPESVTSLSELLFMMSTFISGINAAEFVEEQEQLAQQSNISEYIHHIKTMGGDEKLISDYPLQKERTFSG